jgi:hypothetical protein
MFTFLSENKALRTRVLLLALVLPVAFAIIGILISWYTKNTGFIIISGLSGFLLGVFFNFICYYRKLFAIAIYQTPIPLALFLLVWWISNSFFSPTLAFMAGIGGLLLGLWLNRELVLPYQFFKVNKRVLALLYFFYSIAFMGFFLGIPVFNLLLGLFAGNYIAIRIISYVRDHKEVHDSIHYGSLFSAFVLLLICLISGFFTIHDMQNSLQIIRETMHIKLTAKALVYIIAVSTLVMVVVQYFITRFTANTVLELHKQRKTY